MFAVMLLWRPLLRTQQPAANNFRRVGGLAQRQIAAAFGVTPFAVSRAIVRHHERPAAGKAEQRSERWVLTYRSREKAETPEGMASDSEHSDPRPSGSLHHGLGDGWRDLAGRAPEPQEHSVDWPLCPDRDPSVCRFRRALIASPNPPERGRVAP